MNEFPAVRLFLIALWAYMRAHPAAEFPAFEAAAERAAQMAVGRS